MEKIQADGYPVLAWGKGILPNAVNISRILNKGIVPQYLPMLIDRIGVKDKISAWI